ncbi:unnamed protein product [Onchocerca flexuosa]|uniref:Uncharacterized protein n=1 Tax=Onchocerca flexuosa TaxID=387005 RepID=A0A183HT84_9BILA|nr:unnamed protein product [Onchocerca flexuosa]
MTSLGWFNTTATTTATMTTALATSNHINPEIIHGPLNFPFFVLIFFYHLYIYNNR